MNACINGLNDVIKYFPNSIDLNDKDRFGKTLKPACIKRHKYIVNLFFEENIDLNGKDNCGKTQIMVFENYRKKSHSTLRAKRATFTF